LDGEQLGKYELIRKIASGGMAEVWLARAAGPMGFSKKLVVKRILPHLSEDPAFVQMFLGEARLAAMLNHPNVVQIFDFGEADGTWFLAMEFIDGPTLRGLVKEGNKAGRSLPFAHAARFVAAAAEGLDYAHNLADPDTGELLNLVHRDISPDNVIVSRSGAVKVVDFGIAKAAGQAHHTKTGSVKGKLAYMPPEQLSGEPLDRRADVYALGVVLYEVLTGAKPHAAPSEAALMKAILYDAPTPILEKRPDVPEGLLRVLERSLAKEREDRYATCAELQGDLERFIQSSGEIVGAPQISSLIAEWIPTQHLPGELTPRSTSSSSKPGLRKSRAGDTRPAAEEVPGTLPAGAATQLDVPSASRQSRAGLAAAAVALLGVGGAGAWWALSRRSSEAPAPAAPVPVPVVTQPIPAPPPPPLALDAGPAQVPVPDAGAAQDKADAPEGGAAIKLAPMVLGPGPKVQPTGAGSVAPRPLPSDTAVQPPRPGGPTVGLPVPRPSTPEAGVAASRTAVAAEAREARVEIVTDPPVQVYVNGAFVSVSPAKLTVAAGTVKVTMRDSNLGLDKSVVLELAAGENGTKRLTAARRPLEFRVNPWATVYLDGKLLGDTPMDPVNVWEGRHRVTLVNPEFENKKILDIEVTGSGPNVVKAQFQ
jgi:serine/threonine-protein kinase